jgi:methionine-rich copper-binding protein CopC
LVGFLLLTLVASLIGAGPAGAHGELVGASPGPGETVGRAAHIDLVFSTGMSDWQLTVDGPSGDPLGGLAVQKADQLLSFETPALTSEGQYIVRYSGIDSDGDLIEGAYAFVFEEGAPPPADLPIDLSVLDDDGWSWWVYGILLLGVVVIAVLAGLLAEKVRRLRVAAPV